MKFIPIKSFNFSKKSRKKADIKFLIIHYTGMQSMIASVKRLTNPIHKVSCHYLIDRNGKIYQMVQDQKIAWHAGKSKWKNIINLNSRSIGIELVNKGHRLGYQKFSKKQINNLIKLCKILIKKYRIKNCNILGHSDISPLRKLDPGEKFPWKKLYKKKIGIWYSKDVSKRNKFVTTKRKIRESFFKNLYICGYRYFSLKKSLISDKLVIKSFQRRFRPKRVNGIIDKECMIISGNLAEKYR